MDVGRILRGSLLMDERDSLLVVADRKNFKVGEAFYLAGKKIGNAFMTLMEDWGERPLKEFPWALEAYMELIRPTVTVFVGTTMPGELPFRRGLVEKALSLGARHGHMPNVTFEALEAAMEPEKIEKITMCVYDRLKGVREIHVTSKKGTDLWVRVGKYRWKPDTGVIREGWGNIPGGEVFTTPEKIEGVAVVEELGDYFAGKYGKIDPITLEIENSELVHAQGKIGQELLDYLSKYPCGRRVGEFAIGTNVLIDKLLGLMLHDEKYPGVHIAFGDPLGHHTGADWTCDVHVDAIIMEPTVEVDGELLMREGRFVGGCAGDT